MKYKEKFDKEVKGKKPQYDLKESKIYKTLKDANVLASEVGAHISYITPHNVYKHYVKKQGFTSVSHCARHIFKRV